MSTPPDYHDLDKRLLLTEAAVQRLSDELKQINASLRQLVWAVVFAIVAAAMQFVLRGGLFGAPHV